MSYTIKDVLNLFPETTVKDWNRHKNGGGWVKTSAHADKSAYIEGLVFDNAQVSGNARVFDNARVSGNARVFGDARVFDDAQVFGNAQVYGDAHVSGNAQVYGDAQVFGNA